MLCGCGTAEDYSIHTAKIYIYNYTDTEFYAKLVPTEFKSHEKFREHKSKVIPVTTDDSVKTTPDISFEWIPGEFVYSGYYPHYTSQDYEAELYFYNGKKKIPVENNDYYAGIPSAQDYEVSYYLIKTICKKIIPLKDYNSCLNKITDEEERNTFKSLYDKDLIMEEECFARKKWVNSPEETRDLCIEVEHIINKYNLDEAKVPAVYFRVKKEVKGEMIDVNSNKNS